MQQQDTFKGPGISQFNKNFKQAPSDYEHNKTTDDETHVAGRFYARPASTLLYTMKERLPRHTLNCLNSLSLYEKNSLRSFYLSVYLCCCMSYQRRVSPSDDRDSQGLAGSRDFHVGHFALQDGESSDA